MRIVRITEHLPGTKKTLRLHLDSFPFQIRDRIFQCCHVVLEMAQGRITVLAKQSPNQSRFMIMINSKSFFPWWGFTNSTDSFLLNKDLFILFDCDPKQSFKSPLPTVGFPFFWISFFIFIFERLRALRIFVVRTSASLATAFDVFLSPSYRLRFRTFLALRRSSIPSHFVGIEGFQWQRLTATCAGLQGRFVR